MSDVKTTTDRDQERILVIRFGALGDLIMCRQAFQDIRQGHPDAHIALLTTPPFEALAQTMPWFNSVITAERGPMWQLHKWAKLMNRLYRFAPDRVYDLQGKLRQNIIFSLLGGSLFGPEWSGSAKGCAHPRPWPPAPDMHFVDFLAAQLRAADVPAASPADLGWLDAPLDGLKVPERFALLIPGCSPKLLHKRWPAESYAALAHRLKAERGIDSIAIGTKTEADSIITLRQHAPDVIDFCGKTNLYQLAALARKAVGVVGNDTGPMHLTAAVGAPTIAVLSSHTNPVWSAPYGATTGWVKHDPIADVTVEQVFLALTALLDRKAT